MKPEIKIESFEVFTDGLDHPEGLAFARNGILWAGGEKGQVYRIDKFGKIKQVADMGGFCGGLAFSLADELFICNAKLGVVTITPTGKISIFANRVGKHRIKLANHLVFGRDGTLYVSDSGGWNTHDGFLLCFTPDGEKQVVGGPFGFANGLAISADEKYLFMVESDTARILKFKILDNRKLGRAEIFATKVGRVPDGIVFDKCGNLYACCYASDDIYRISPDGKKKLFAYDPNGMLLGGPTNMAFGGTDNSDLYIANLGRRAITKVHTHVTGQPLANQKQCY